MGKNAHGKRYRQDLAKVPAEPVPLPEAVKVLKQFNHAKFDQTVELVVWLGIDPKQSEQQLRGAIALPHGIGRSKRVVAFCDEEQAEAARQAGAIEAGADTLIKKIEGGWTDFDVAVAIPKMMRSVSRLGRILGPLGKMPSPKAGTVVEDIPAAVREYAGGKFEFRNDDLGNVHVPVGKMSFTEDQLVANIRAFLERIQAMKPPTSKGTFLKKACISATMTPAIRLSV
jgi:large subunit ribosomal protein L1